MKSLKMMIAAACLEAFTLGAAEPYLSFPLNEGDLAAIKEATGTIKKVGIWNKEQFSWTDGANGKALCFNTPDASKTFAGVHFYMPADFDPTAGFTFTALVKTPEKMHRSRQYQLFFWSNNHQSGPGFRIYVSWKSLYVMMGNGGKKGTVVASKNSHGPLQDNTWYQLAVSYSNGQIKIYIDGVLRGTANDCAFAKSSRKWAAIGASAERGSAYGFNGIISNVNIYKGALSDDEIAAIKPE